MIRTYKLTQLSNNEKEIKIISVIKEYRIMQLIFLISSGLISSKPINLTRTLILKVLEVIYQKDINKPVSIRLSEY